MVIGMFPRCSPLADLKRFINLEAFIQHVNWCIPTRGVFQKTYLSGLKKLTSAICIIVYSFFP